MQKICYPIVAAVFLYGLPVVATENASSDEAGYDLICQYFIDLDEVVSKGAVTPVQREQFVSARVNAHIAKQSDPWALWDTIRYAVPEERYEMFKSTVEEITGKAWECKSMEQLISTVGE